MSDAEDKKHVATPQKRKRAREEGHVLRSQDLSSHVVLTCSLAVLWWSGPALYHALSSIMEQSFSQPMNWQVDSHSISQLLASYAASCLRVLLPLFAAIAATACLSTSLQNGFLFSPRPIQLDWQRIDPSQRLGKTFRWYSLGNLGLSLGRLAAVGTVVVLCLQSHWSQLSSLPYLPLRESAALGWNLLLQTSMATAATLLAFSLLDLGIQYWQYELSLKMTDEELREEAKALGSGSQAIRARKRT